MSRNIPGFSRLFSRDAILYSKRPDFCARARYYSQKSLCLCLFSLFSGCVNVDPELSVDPGPVGFDRRRRPVRCRLPLLSGHAGLERARTRGSAFHGRLPVQHTAGSKVKYRTSSKTLKCSEKNDFCMENFLNLCRKISTIKI